ncbi:hypothetical protein, partial [Pseudomonas sp.]|uniref:hypothetical protein n=1 Tax=Pseudomonas sp. TaxID=306 RepID=UPI0025E6AD57
MLGVIGSQLTFEPARDGKEYITVRRNIKNNQKVEYLSKLLNDSANISDCEFKHFCGGYGNASFTLDGLVQRNLLGMNRFSDQINKRHWIKFLGGGVRFPPNDEIDFLFRISLHRPRNDPDRSHKDLWNHPAHLLNLPGTVIIESIKRTKCCKWRHLNFRPPSEFEGWYDLGTFSKFTLMSYYWTTIEMSNPMGIAPYTVDFNENNAPLTNRWWGSSNSARACPWINRKAWDQQFLSSYENSWLQQLIDAVTDHQRRPNYSPFCPAVYRSNSPQSLWFLYYFKFQIGGLNIDQKFQNWPIVEYTTPPVRAAAEIRRGELDESGWLRDDAFARIIGAGDEDGVARTAVLTEQQRKLYKLLYAKYGPQRRVRWGWKRTRRIDPRRRLVRARERLHRRRMGEHWEQQWGG